MSEELLKRQLLLMKYDMSTTLTENIDNIDSVISEQGVIKDIVRGGGVAARELEGVLKTMMKDSKVANELKNVTLTDAKGMRTGVRTAEELASAIKLGKLNGFLKGELELAILKSRTTNQALIDAAASNLARNKSFINKYSSSLAKGQVEYEKALKSAGYSEEAISSIVKQTENIGGKIKNAEDIVKGSGNIAKDVEAGRSIRQERDLSNLKTQKGKWEGLKNLAKMKGFKVIEYARNLGWKKIIMYGAAGWLAVYLWRNWNSSKPKIWSQCLIDFVGYNNFSKAVQIKPGILSVKGKTGLQSLDMNGFTYFRNDGTAKNGQFEGNWECDGGKLVVTFDGQDYYPVKGSVAPVIDNGGGSNNSGGGSASQPTYRACSGTYNKGCKSEVIRKVQGCLGVKMDGLFGPKTETAVQSKLGKLIFTDTDVDGICGMAQNSTTTTTTVKPISEPSTIEPESVNVNDFLAGV